MQNTDAISNLMDAATYAGADREIFKNKDNGFMLVDKNKILSLNKIKGLNVDATEIPNGIKAKITVLKDHRLDKPVHLCFGITGTTGEQVIDTEIVLEENSEVKLISYCSFPKAIDVKHKMKSIVKIGKNAKMVYEEVHFHGQDGGVTILPYTEGHIEENGYMKSEFKLVNGRVGKIDLVYDFKLDKYAIAEMDSKIYATKNDYIKITEKMYLNGEGSRGTVKARVFAADETYSEVYTEIHGNAPHAKGHVDCIEVVKGDKAIVSAVPIIRVTNDLAELTHEASIGRVNKKELETLMARGLTEDEATDMIVKGMLK
ncbi:MAG: SufD family Fe-S cluster assembly protein [Fusobacteria bacterium]|nr:SufD family Fe-S cluster assembly protein [Fusobacteriota bacterium]